MASSALAGTGIEPGAALCHSEHYLTPPHHGWSRLQNQGLRALPATPFCQDNSRHCHELLAQENQNGATEMMGSSIRRFVRRTEGLKLQLLLSEAHTTSSSCLI